MHRLPQGRGAKATRNTQLTAALTTLGFQVQTNIKIHEGTGERQTTFTISDTPVVGGLMLQSSALIHQFDSGALESRLPNHQLLDAMRGLHNRAALLSWIKSGIPQTLAIHPSPDCPRATYVPGKPVSPHSSFVIPPSSFIRTPDIAIASACGLIGIPARLEGDASNTIFVLPPFGFPLHGAPPQDTKQILADHESGALARDCPLHPFRYALQAVYHYRILLDTLASEMPMIFFEDANQTGRAALIRQDAKSISYDRAKKFFDKPLT